MPWTGQVFAILAGILLVAALAFLVLWLRARATSNRLTGSDSTHQLERIDLELQVADQAARLRIIREMHEVAALELTRIIAQSDGAKYASAKDPSAAVRSAVTMGEGARIVLADLRRVTPTVGDGIATAVAPLASIRELVDVMGADGLAIEFTETGDSFELTPGAGLAVSRILQEALANALEYGGVGTIAQVSIGWTGDSLRVAIDDDGARAASRRDGLDPDEVARHQEHDDATKMEALTGVSGAGIAEMRERAEHFGGTLAAQPVPGFGFSVSVVFPAIRYNNGVHSVNLIHDQE